MSALVTLAQALRHLRLPAAGSPLTDEETDIQLKLDVAEELVLGYVRQRRSDTEEWEAIVAAWTPESPGSPGSPDTTVPKVVQQAILIQLGEFYRFRGDDVPAQSHERDYGRLHPAVEALLHRLRDPAIS